MQMGSPISGAGCAAGDESEVTHVMCIPILQREMMFHTRFTWRTGAGAAAGAGGCAAGGAPPGAGQPMMSLMYSRS